MQAVNNSSVEWDGLATFNRGPCCGSYTYAWAKINKHFTDSYGAATRKGVAGHELGHILGLDHSGKHPRLMNPCTNGTGCRASFGVTTPQTDDINGVQFIY